VRAGVLVAKLIAREVGQVVLGDRVEAPVPEPPTAFGIRAGLRPGDDGGVDVFARLLVAVVAVVDAFAKPAPAPAEDQGQENSVSWWRRLFGR
jgi:hypothetical protein